MPSIQSEVRMIWLMLLMITAVAAWFLATPILTYLCGIALVISLMQYVDAIQKPIAHLSKHNSIEIGNQASQIDAHQTGFNRAEPFVEQVVDQSAGLRVEQWRSNSKIPLYISSIIALVGGWLELSWMLGLGVTVWIFFFLRWLRRLETHLEIIHDRLSLMQSPRLNASARLNEKLESSHVVATNIDRSQALTTQDAAAELSFTEQLRHWLLSGNPVLKVAILILVVGVILLLRFATEHWQLSLALKLGIVAIVSGVITLLGYVLQHKNRSFSLALEGLGLAGLFLTLFFAYYNLVLENFMLVALCFGLIMLLTLRLSLKHQAIELALMAMMIAYLAPFTLPVRDATAIELIAYYLVINVAVAILSTLRPWKILNQLAFMSTILIGGAYAFLHGYSHERYVMTALVLAHSSIFIWLSFRFSQLLAKADLVQFKLKPALDVVLIFSAPIVAYIYIYLMHFEDSIWQAGMSLVFALVYAVLYRLAKRNQTISLIGQSYWSLMLIFLALIPPILLPEQWSVVGWAIEGAVIFSYALYRQSRVGRYLAMGLLIIAGISSLYYWVELAQFPSLMFWILTLCYFAVLLIANSFQGFKKQICIGTIVFLSLLSMFASSMLLILGLDYFEGPHQWVASLLLVSIAFILINEWMYKVKAQWSWLLPKWFALSVLFVFALMILAQQYQHGILLWDTLFNRMGFAAATLLICILWLRPMQGLQAEKEGLSLGFLATLALASLTLIAHMPFISVVILPLIFCAWCFFKKNNLDWQIFWQAKTTLLLMLLWIIASQLLSQQAFYGYYLPMLNPFDLVSLAMLVGFIWILSLQLKAGLDQAIVALLIVLSLLWLSSYIVLRGLHIYFETPYNHLSLWGNSLVQLSLTLLWVSLAFITMSLASLKKLRSIWILGGSILCVVTFKLVLLDLSHVGTLTRVVSFLAAGLAMLIIAYIAPIPERDQDIADSSRG